MACLAGLASPILLAPAPAQAQQQEATEEAEQPGYDPAARAAEHYEEAAQAYGEGNFERAAELLQRAFAHDPNLIYKYNEILALMGMGDYEQALRLLDTFGEPMEADGRFTDLDELEAELKEAIAAAETDGEDEAPEEEEPLVVEQPPELEPQEEVADSPNILAWTLVGTGAALLGGGGFVASGILIADEMERLNQYTSVEYEDSDEFSHEADVSVLNTHRIISVVLLSAGFAATATGVGLLLFDRGDANPQAREGLQLTPMADGQNLGASLSGRF